MSIDDGLIESAELRRLHARAQELVDAALTGLAVADLARATPCAQWNLGDLLGHMLGQNRALAAAVAGGGSDLAARRPVIPGPDPATELARTERELVAAFADHGMGGVVWMPELSPSAPIPARIALLAHLIDTVVHGWDVAASRSRSYAVPADLLAVATSVAQRIPDGAGRGPGAAFGPARSTDGTDALGDLLARLGRDPHWHDG